MGTELIPLAFSSGWASGVNAYLAVLVLGLAERMFHLAQIPDALARTDVLVAAGVMFAIEMVADKVPYIDSLWDSVHTVIRPVIGASLGYLVGDLASSGSADAILGAGTGGITALLSHGVKAGLRAAVNTSPEPASNIIVSSGEDVAVTGVMAIAINHPWISATIALILLALGAWLVIKLASRIRRFKRKYDAWGERIGIAVPTGDAAAATAPPPRGWPKRRELMGGRTGSRRRTREPLPEDLQVPRVAPRHSDEEPFDQEG